MFACSADRKFTKTVEALLEHPDIDVNVRNPVWIVAELIIQSTIRSVFTMFLPASNAPFWADHWLHSTHVCDI